MKRYPIPTVPAPSGGEKPPPYNAREEREEKREDEEVNSYAKGGSVKACSYASGGPVLGRTRDFMKEPDRFRTSGAGTPRGKPEPTEDVYPKSGKGEQGKDKSLKAIKPRG